MFSIIINEKGGEERREAFDRTEIKVGRVEGNDLLLRKGNVSKRHARLLYRDGRFIVTDLKSTNGTYVNGRKIAQATIVREGDKIYIGDFVLRIEMNGVQPRASQPGDPSEISSDPGDPGHRGGSPTALPGALPGMASGASSIGIHPMAEPNVPGPGYPATYQGPAPNYQSSTNSAFPPRYSPPPRAISQIDPAIAEAPAQASLVPSPAVSPAPPAIVPLVSSSPPPVTPFPAAAQPSSQPSSSVPRRPEKPVDPSQAAEHRTALATLMQRVLTHVDVAPLAAGGPADPALAAAIERALREQSATLQIPSGLDVETLVAEARRELLELGPIGPLLEDEEVEEVQLIRHDYIIAMHGRKQVATEIAFTSEEAVARLIRRVCHRAGRPLGRDELFLERRLEHGGRLFGVLPPASGEGHLCVFRKPQRAAATLDDLVRSGTISRTIATLLGQCVAARANILVTGAVNSGTALVLGALAGAGSVDDRVIVLQEDDELVFNQLHTVSILIGDTAEAGARAVRTAIRVRPDRLVVGAFAGHVVAEVLDAVGDGIDGVLASARAPTLRHLTQRCPADLAVTRGLPSIDTAREWLAASFDLIIEVARLRDGRHRVLRVSEFAYNLEGGSRELTARDIFTFTVERTASGGAVEGSFHATGHVPRFLEDLSARGSAVDLSMFTRPSR